MTTDLTDLVDNPRETLDIELKQWLDLKDKENRAKLARHLAALCNHGGGYLVFGFRDDTSVDPHRPASLQEYNHDEINGIVDRYLTPTFDCQVSHVESSSGLDYPTVRVPGHGVVPVCAANGGPHDSKGRPVGIRAGAYYIREPGPKSVEISRPEQWTDLIRRCTINDRDVLLRQITDILQGAAQAAPTTTNLLAQWDTATAKRFTGFLAAATGFTWPVALADAHYQLSYLIVHDEKPKPIGEMSRILEEVNNEVRDTVWTGWSMFYPFTRPEIAPRVHSENPDGTGVDLLETNLLEGRKFDTSVPDFWRVTCDGRASLVRGYREDARLPEPGKWLWPVTVLRETAELVQHAHALARYFPSATAISFQCTWIGLRGREIYDADTDYIWSRSRAATADRRVTQGEWKIAQISADWPGIVAELGCPVLAYFGMDYCDAGLVRELAPRFKRL